MVATTTIDHIAAALVVAGTGGVVVVRAVVSWRDHRLQRRMAELMADAVGRLEERVPASARHGPEGWEEWPWGR